MCGNASVACRLSDNFWLFSDLVDPPDLRTAINYLATCRNKCRLCMIALCMKHISITFKSFSDIRVCAM